MEKDLDNISQKSDQSFLDVRSNEDQTFEDHPVQIQDAIEPIQQKLELNVSIDAPPSQKVHKQLQLIYIVKYSDIYNQHLLQIASNYDCEIKFLKSSYTISGKSSKNYERWTKCKEIINQQFDKVIFTKYDDKDKKYRLYNSPQVNRFANQRKVYFCEFNHQIYLHSNCYSSKQLEEKKTQINKYCNLFAVCFLRKKTLQAIDEQIALFYRTVLSQYYRQRFQKNDLVVEINKPGKSFYILGKPGSNYKMMMQAKKTIKSLIEGIVVVAFKDFVLDSKDQIKLREYLKKISKFPVIFGKLSQNVIVLISKDNVIRQLLKKTDKIKQKVGIVEDTSIGIYMPFCYSRDEKKEQINKICKQMGYDYWSTWGIRYFRPMIASDDDIKNPTQILELLTRIIGEFIEVKDKYQTMKDKQQPETKVDAKKKKQLQEQDKYAYILKNCPKDSIQMTKILRRDTMEDQVLMKKRYNVIYNLLEGKQIGPYYIDQAQYDKGVDKGDIKLLEVQKLKKGNYFETYLKLDEHSYEKQDIQELQNLLYQELRKLKKAAKEDKQEWKSMDSDRKIGHMIKKLIMVF